MIFTCGTSTTGTLICTRVRGLLLSGLLPIAALCCVAGLAAPTEAAAQTNVALRDTLNQILFDANTPNAIWAVRVLETESGKVVYDRNGFTSMIPASNTKLYTTAAALELLGPDFTYETGLYATGRVRNGTLEGALVVKGSGDPVIGGRFNDGDLTETFRNWADSLKAAGIYRIEGDIVGDDNVFDDVPLGHSWAWDDEPYWYSAEISGLSFNDNCVDFALVAAVENQPAHLTWEPAFTTYVSTENASVTGPADSGIREGYSRTRDGNRFRFWSRVPEGRTDFESLSVNNPTLFFVHVLRETLLAEGISVGGSPRDVDALSFPPDYTTATRIAVHTSPPMTDIVTVINKRSQNLYAEQVLKTLGRVVNDSTGASAADGVRASLDVFGSARVDTARIQLVDGSGLSRLNLVTADMTTDVLQYMAHHPDSTIRRVFSTSLPIAGVDGTIGARMRNTPAAGNLTGKTGTLGSASALSGYVTNASGTRLTFSVMVNHYTGSTSNVRGIQDRIGAALARSVD